MVKPGTLGLDDLPGNEVVVRLKGDRSAVYAQLIPGSVKVKVGVRAGAGEEFRRLGRSRGVPAASVRFRRERAEPEARSQGPGGTFFNLFAPHTVPHGQVTSLEVV
jgi:hypothetical protein